MPCKNMSHHQASQKPVDESPSTMVGWPASKPHCSSEASAEELERFAMVWLPQRFLDECKTFSTNPSSSISEEDGE